MGNLFDVDAVLCSDQLCTDEQYYDIDNPYFTSVSGKSIHTRPFHRYDPTKTRSKGSNNFHLIEIKSLLYVY